MDFLFHSLSLCSRHLKIVLFGRFSSAETDSVESTTTVECVTTEKLILKDFLNSSKLPNKTARIISSLS
jgi:hypothetical protein